MRAPKVHVVVNALLVDAVGSQKSCSRRGVDEFGVGEVFVDALEAVMTEANTSRPSPGFAGRKCLHAEPRAPSERTQAGSAPWAVAVQSTSTIPLPGRSRFRVSVVCLCDARSFRAREMPQVSRTIRVSHALQRRSTGPGESRIPRGSRIFDFDRRLSHSPAVPNLQLEVDPKLGLDMVSRRRAKPGYNAGECPRDEEPATSVSGPLASWADRRAKNRRPLTAIKSYNLRRRCG